MAGPSAIEWTDATWNPIVGCSIVSPGCTNCYAMKMAGRIEAMTAELRREGKTGAPHYDGTTKPSKAGAVWTGKLALAPDHILTEPLRWRKPRRIFVNSMGDLFHEDAPDEWIDRVFAVMALCPQHTFQVLTKRPERMRAWLAERWQPAPAQHLDLGGGDAIDVPAEETGHGRHEEVYQACEQIFELLPAMADTENEALWNDRGSLKCRDFAWPLPNVWLGTSCERQTEADERIPRLLQTPAAVRFVSLEPLLGPINLDPIDCGGGILWNALGRTKGGDIGGLDWVIAGGESGPKARPMHPDWARSIRDQCTAAGVPFFFKQWGGHAVVHDRDRDDPDWRDCADVKFTTPNGQWLNLAGGQGFHGERVVRVDRVGKRAAGRLLDGREWNQFPAAVIPPPQSGGGGPAKPVEGAPPC